MKRTLKMIFTSDTHGRIFPVDYANNRESAGGLLNLAGQLEKDGNTLVIDGGDSLQGTPLMRYYLEHRKDYAFHPAAEAFNALGCDYFTLGNHDFNFGYEVLREYLAAMKAQCVCANVQDLRGELPLKKEVIHTLENGLRVGICGVVTDHVNVWEQPENLRELRVTDPIEAASAAYVRMRGACDVCICVYHGGFEEDLATGKRLSESRENCACALARAIPFDFLLTGHQHMPVPGIRIGECFAVQPPACAEEFIEINAAVSEDGAVTVAEYGLRPVCGRHAKEPYRKMLPLETAVQEWLDQPIGFLSEEIKPEEKLMAALCGSRLADLFNAVQLAETGADFSCTSLGNEPVGLPREVSVRSICAAYQFSNTLEVLEVRREDLKESLERCASYFELKNGMPEISERFLKPKVEHYNYDFYAGLRYAFDLRRPVGDRVTILQTLDGKALEDRSYTLVTSNYRATGTGGYERLGSCRKLSGGAAEMPDLAADYIRMHSPLPKIHNREFEVKW